MNLNGTAMCTTCGKPADPHPYRHPITLAPTDSPADTSNADDFRALIDEHLKRKAEALERQFNPATWVCRKCAALVTDREPHAAFHKAIEEHAKNVFDTFEKWGKQRER
jgi:hypothetical protein